MIGETISHYKILEKLGEGGMGVVYKAQDTKLKRTVALKFLPRELLCDSQAKARFMHEAQVASALNHPNITTIYEIDEIEGECFIAMEYIEGKSIKEMIKEKEIEGWDMIKLKDVCIQITEGLSKAHEKGIIHRDIKSENIMLTNEGLVKIMDFGLAKLKGATKLTKTGSMVGTVSYMSPEQTRGEEVDHRTDIWSLGVVFYEMATGELPFKGDYEQAVIYSILNEEPEPTTGLWSCLPKELERTINKALAKSVDSRYQKAEDILNDLRELRKGLESKFLKERISTENPLPSLAVLPFVDMSPQKDQEYFCDGLAEELINALTHIRDLHVVSRTSAFSFKGKEMDIREIGRRLNVEALLEGSVRKAGDRLRMTAQLINVSDGYHLWSEKYDREMKDIFDIQSDVAQNIAMALKTKLSPEEKEQIKKKPTEDLAAYDYYLKGREYYYRYRKQDNEQAIRLFKKAIELDPDYALAYAGLGDAYAQRTIRLGFDANWLDSAIEASQKAISIDPNCEEAHKALGLAYGAKGWLSKALEAYQKSVELNPNYFPAIGNIGVIYQMLGKSDKALKWAKKDLALSPTMPISHVAVGKYYMYLGDDAKADLYYRKALELQPDFYYALFELGFIYLAQGKYDQAKSCSREVLSIAPDDMLALEFSGIVELFTGNYQQAKKYYEKMLEILSTGLRGLEYLSCNTQLAFIYWKTDQQDKAKKMLSSSLDLAQKLLEQGNELCNVPYNIAGIKAIQGNKKEAYLWLQKAIDAGYRDYRIISIDPFLENLHNDEQFKKMIAKVKAMVHEMRMSVEEMEE